MIKGNNLLRFFALYLNLAAAADVAGLETNTSPNPLVLKFLGPPLLLPEWIVAACDLSPIEPLGQLKLAVLVTSNRVLIASKDLTDGIKVHGHSKSPTWIPKTLAQGRSVALYSGHMTLDDSSLVIASGTVFGQVLLWKVRFDNTSRNTQSSSLQLASFHAHEGSVFGVHIACSMKHENRATIYRVASCSDDRTVRVYEVHDAIDAALVDAEVTRTGFADHPLDVSSRNATLGVSSTSVHISRIWSVRWLNIGASDSLLISFGEDTTSQLWQVQEISSKASKSLQVKPLIGHEFHSGKNIWSSIIVQQAKESLSPLIYTGGADGRIVRYSLEQQISSISAGWRYEISQSTLDEILSSDESRTVPAKHDFIAQLFASLEGQWTIHRVISSRRPEYPSGTFDGKAVLMKRPATGDGFDDEMLYSEEGTFAMGGGLSMPARRSYVYRYEKKVQKITAWFVKPDGSDVVDYLFHQVEFDENALPQRNFSSETSSAKGYHLCVQDHYNAEYAFDHKDNFLRKWTLSYHVSGPEKDYTATSIFTRNAQNSGSIVSLKEKDHVQPISEYKRPGTFRGYCWVNRNAFICVTDSGGIIGACMSFNRSSSDNLRVSQNTTQKPGDIDSWLIAYKSSLKGYSILTNIGSIGALIADGEGCIIFVPFAVNTGTSLRTQTYHRVHEAKSKVIFMSTQESGEAGGSVFTVIYQILKEHRLYSLSLKLSDLSNSSGDGEHLAVENPAALDNPMRLKITSTAFSSRYGFLFCGTRKGEICVWRHRSQIQLGDGLENEPISYARAHGADTVTSISIEDTANDRKDFELIFWTSGIDGFIKRHVLRWGAKSTRVETISAFRHQSGFPLHGMRLANNRVQVLTWGFMGLYFVLWDVTKQQELLRVNCGSGHRIWSFKPCEDMNTFGGSFVWTQAGACHVYQQFAPSHQILTLGGHGREIKAITSTCLQQPGIDKPLRIAVTGAEDTNIRIFDVGVVGFAGDDISGPPSFNCLATLYKHITGLSVLQFVPSFNILLSGGGKEELFAWKIGVDRRDLCSLPDVLCIGVCPKVTDDGDLRVTDLDVFDPITIQSLRNGLHQAEQKNKAVISVVYSDSSIRIWRLDTSTGEFEMLAAARYSANCLTCVKYVSIGGEVLLLVASTDGHIVLYDLSSLEDFTEREIWDKADPKPQLKALLRYRLHQSSIKGLDARTVSPSELLVATGGDDNALALTRIFLVSGDPRHPESDLHASGLSSSSSKSRFSVATTLIPRAHAAAVNAVRFLDPRKNENPSAKEASNDDVQIKSFLIATASNDQIVRTWQVSIALDPEEADKPTTSQRITIWRRSQCSDVADASCLDSFDGVVVVGGVGIEILDAEGGS